MEKTGQSHFAGQPLGPKMDFIQILTRGGYIGEHRVLPELYRAKTGIFGPIWTQFPREKKNYATFSQESREKSKLALSIGVAQKNTVNFGHFRSTLRHAGGGGSEMADT